MKRNFLFFFFQAEDGIRDKLVTGVQTCALPISVAARIVGTVVHECAGPTNGDFRLGHPSGVLPIDAAVRVRDGAPWAERVTVYRTARRLMEGFVRVP